MDTDLFDLLSRVDTPTVLNGIEVVQGKRGFQGYTRGTMICTEPGRAMVGYAATAQIAGLAPPQEPVDVIRARRMALATAKWRALGEFDVATGSCKRGNSQVGLLASTGVRVALSD